MTESSITFVEPKVQVETFSSVNIGEVMEFLGEMGLLTSEKEIEKILMEQEFEELIEIDFNELIQLITEKVNKVNESKAIMRCSNSLTRMGTDLYQQTN